MNEGPPPVPPDDRPSGLRGWLRWFRRTDQPAVQFLREFLASAFVVVLVGLLLFGVSGVWPPLVAVESGSMTPHLQRGDLVFVMDDSRFVPAAADAGTGVISHRTATDTGYRSFGSYGDVIVFSPDGSNRTPIIHRARFWVSAGENWYPEANRSFLRGQGCSVVPNCPAPHSGFITKGDANEYYDQVSGISGPVRPEWIRGTAEFRIPWLGYVRLQFSSIGPF